MSNLKIRTDRLKLVAGTRETLRAQPELTPSIRVLEKNRFKLIG